MSGVRSSLACFSNLAIATVTSEEEMSESRANSPYVSFQSEMD
jgi:hypothetical protein